MNNNDKDYNFFDAVYQVVRLIPYGRVSSYGAIGKYLGSAKSARMVGWALNGCSKLTLYVPAHRVVNRVGVLTGKNHFNELNDMCEKLRSEGIDIENYQIIDFERVFWDPIKELI